MELDFLVFTAHPDDAEISIGGTIAKLVKQNKKVGIVDFTQGELGTRGTAETRKKEAEDASKILGITIRDNLNIPDGKVHPCREYVEKVIVQIRKYRPKIICAPYFNDRHPDHIGAGQITKEAMFLSGLPKIKTRRNNKPQEAYRPEKLFYFMMTYQFDPTFIVDISDTLETKIKAIRAFKTQFYDPDTKAPETFISKPDFLRNIEARAKIYGFEIRKEYGEPFYSEEKIEMDFKWMINRV